MKKILFVKIVTFIGIVLLGGCDFAAKHDLSPDPVSQLTMEILDASDVNTYNPASQYISFVTTQPEWIDYLAGEAKVILPPDANKSRFNKRAKMIPMELESGNYFIEMGLNENPILQGRYDLELSYGTPTSDGKIRLENGSYDYLMTLNVDGEGERSLGVRHGSTASGSPYITEQDMSYEVAISDDGETLYFRPTDGYSAGNNVLLYFGTSNSNWFFYVLPSTAMEENSWTPISSADLIRTSEHTLELDTANARDGILKVRVFGSRYTTTSWGGLFRSQLKGFDFEDFEPAASSVLSVNRSASSGTGFLSPLAQKDLEQVLANGQ